MKLKLLLPIAILFSTFRVDSAEFPSSKGTAEGDHQELTSDVYPVPPAFNGVPGDRCAGMGSRYTVDQVTKDYVFITFTKIAKPAGEGTCPAGALPVSEASQYKLPIETYLRIGYKSTGVAFGGLVVPFKFRLGDDKKLVSSATIAPYIGLRWYKLQYFGMECIPVFSAGLALVPVSAADGKTTDTKAAFSTAIGFTVNSQKNPDFSAGVLLGKDFLSKSDRAIDPSINKLWISAWVGISK